MNPFNIASNSSSSASTPTPFSRFGEPLPTIGEQINDFAHLDTLLSVEDLPRITVKRKQYVQEERINKKQNSKRYSWIGQHGLYLVQMNENIKGETFWSCNSCDKARDSQLYKTGTSGNAERHLKNKHDIKNPRDLSTTLSSSASANVRTMQILGAKRQKIRDTPTTTDAADLFKMTLIRWIIKANIPLTGPEDEEFHCLIDLASLGSNHLVNLVPTGDTIRTWILKEFNHRKQDIKQQLLEDAEGKIHLSFDLWTSDGTTMSIMAVVAHYLDKSFINRTRLIALRRLYGSHSGENMAKILISVIQEFEITKRLGYFMMDNDATNDTCLESLLRDIDPNISDSDIDERRLRCWGHILNLVAKAFLFGTNANAFELEDQANITLGREQERFQAWRKKGPVGKLHNLVVFIRASTQRKELFKNVSLATVDEIDGLAINEDTQNLGVIKDNETRWNSTYLMIVRALKKRQEINAFIQVLDVRPAEKPVPREDRLSANDWLIIEETAYILKPIYDHTIRFQSRAKEGHHGTIWEVLPSMELILHHLETLKTQYTDPPNPETHNHQGLAPQDIPRQDTPPLHPPAAEEEPTATRNTRHAAQRRPVGYQPPPRRAAQPTNPSPSPPPPPARDAALSNEDRLHFRAAINIAWAKLEKYYNRTDRSRAYFGSVRMHPALNTAWFDQNWTQDDQLEWIEGAETALRDHYNRFYRDQENYGAQSTNPSPPPPPSPYEPDEFDNFLTPATFYARPQAIDEYDRYKSLHPIQEALYKPLAWWRDHRNEYPTLSKMALDLFSVPAMSAECERVFSQAKLVITSQRHHLNAEILEAILCLKLWWKDDAYG
jgi:hypothetical protein